MTESLRPAPSRRGRQSLTLLLVAGLAAMAVPAATAWSLPEARLDDVRPDWAAWTTDLVPRPLPANAAAAVASAVGCALGDVSGDGIADLLVLVSDPAAGVQRLTALAGPGFQDVVWEKVSSLGQILQCAPDLDLDGTLDPILHTLGEATGTAAAGAVDQARSQVQQVLSGASGAAMLGRVAADQVTGAAVPLAGTAAGAAQTATSALLPAAAGAAAFLQTSATTAALPIPAGVPALPLPLDAVTAQLTSAAELQVLDAAGAVVATISIEEAGVNPLALAPVPLTGGLPDVAVLTQALSPVQEAATGVAELALYNADGTLAWATQLPASTGLPILLPQAGDLDLDGVGDLIVSTVQQGVEQVPGAAYTVLSGVDGSVLLQSGAAVTGLMTALPLGQLPNGAALLEVASAEGASTLALNALDGAGSVLWSVDLDALARPVNAALDAHTGDITGFTDLTGDAVPDVAVVVEQATGAAQAAQGLALQVIDGLTGEIVQDLPLPGADDVIPVVVTTASQLAQRGGAAADEAIASVGGEVEHVTEGATTALLALGTTATEATVALVDPVAGQIEWVATAALPAGADIASLSAAVAGDLDGDGVQDLLVTANANGTAAGGPGSASRSGQAGRAADADGSGDTPASVTAVSGRTGETLYASSASPGDEEVVYESGGSPQGDAEADDGDSNGVPAPAPGLLLAAVVAVALLLRRRA